MTLVVCFAVRANLECKAISGLLVNYFPKKSQESRLTVNSVLVLTQPL